MCGNRGSIEVDNLRIMIVSDSYDNDKRAASELLVTHYNKFT
jgi:hypothetical protein